MAEEAWNFNVKANESTVQLRNVTAKARNCLRRLGISP